MGVFTVCILWISNLLWYPSIFSLIATNFAYLFDVSLAQNKLFVLGFGVILFWLFTALNCIGVKFSSKTSIVCSVMGIITPMFLITIGGLIWWLSNKPVAISLDKAAFFPELSHINNVGLLIAIVISLFGVELTAVHAGNVINPKRDYPLSLLISSITVLVLLLLSEMAIAVIIPVEKLSVVTGLLDALTTFFQEMHRSYLIIPILLLVFIGNVGSVAAWMLGSTRGMYVACQKNHVAPFLQKVNRFEAPIGVLIFEAIIFTLVSGIFLIFPNVTDSFWLLLDLASQITLIYYAILFISAIRLRYLPVLAKGFIIPGGSLVLWTIMGMGIFTSFFTLYAGFIVPENLGKSEVVLFHLTMSIGLILTILLPILFLLFRKRIPDSLRNK